jgi:ubiquinone/menaquinone biosynthesis C-methylase UbiE
MPRGALTQADFDRIALLSTDEWDHNSHYHGFLLKHVPSPCDDALDIGCGTGSFARLLAQRCKRVLALDLSPQMIQVARAHSKRYTNIDFRVADAMAWQFPAERFDCIASIAALHHLPFGETLADMKRSLKVGGALLILDLFQGRGPLDWLVSAIAWPADLFSNSPNVAGWENQPRRARPGMRMDGTTRISRCPRSARSVPTFCPAQA